MHISVIIATKNRAHHLKECLNSIISSIANVPSVKAEIIVVNNNSSDETDLLLKNISAESSCPIIVLFEEKNGLSAAHNKALSVAKGGLLVFTDDDCRMSVGYITDLLAHYEKDEAPVVRGGRIDLGDSADLPLTVITRQEKILFSPRKNTARNANIGDCIAGANMVVPKKLADRLGKFDENFGSGSKIGAGNDIDYVMRSYLAGADIEYVPDMAVSHFHGRKTAKVGFNLLRTYMTGSGALYAKYFFRHPDFCRPFYWDCKNAVREGTRNTFLPFIGFSHKHKVLYALKGFFLYWMLFRKP